MCICLISCWLCYYLGKNWSDGRENYDKHHPNDCRASKKPFLVNFNRKSKCSYSEHFRCVDNVSSVCVRPTYTCIYCYMSVLAYCIYQICCSFTMLLLSPGVSSQENCERESPRPSGIALKVVYRQLPGQEFFSTLLGFAEETTNCPLVHS